MASLPDVYIRYWQTDPADNQPQGITPVGTLFNANLRNIKSIIRAYSLDAAWLTSSQMGEPSTSERFTFSGTLPVATNLHTRKIRLQMSNGRTWYGWVNYQAAISGGYEIGVAFDPESGPFTPGSGVMITDWAVSTQGANPSTLPVDHFIATVTITGPARRSAAIIHPFVGSGGGAGVLLITEIMATLVSPAVGTGGVASSIVYPVQVGSDFFLEVPVAPSGGTVMTFRTVISHGSSPWPV